jgi:hypothetical protein
VIFINKINIMNRRIVRLTESDMNRLVRRIVREQSTQPPAQPAQTQPKSPSTGNIDVKNVEDLKKVLFPLFNNGKGGINPPMNGSKWTIGAVGSSNFYLRFFKEDGTTITLTI